MIVATVFLTLVCLLVAKMVIDVQASKKRRFHEIKESAELIELEESEATEVSEP